MSNPEIDRLMQPHGNPEMRPEYPPPAQPIPLTPQQIAALGSAAIQGAQR